MIKIMPPAFEIIDNDDTILERIERVGRVCYKSEDKITSDSRFKFVERVIERGHNSVLEFGVLSIKVTPKTTGGMKHLIDICNSLRWVTYEVTKCTDIVITASLRVWLDVISWDIYPLTGIATQVLATDEETCELVHDKPRYDDIYEDYGIEVVPEKEVCQELRRILVKLTVSRAVSHQLVRHRLCSFMQESQRYCRYDEEIVFIKPSWYHEPQFAKARAAFIEGCYNVQDAYRTRLHLGLAPQAARGCLSQDTKTEIYVLADREEWRHIFSQRCSPGADPEMRKIMVPLYKEFCNRGLLDE